MIWEKQGLLFAVKCEYDWNQSHAQVPVVDVVDEKIWRIYYATRDINNRSTTTYIDVEAGNPQNILYIHDKPILAFGALGSFDETGIMPSSIITLNSVKYLYYIGWSQKKSVPYQNTNGLAISIDNGITFKKFSEGPIIGVNHIDPFFTGTMFVLQDDKTFRAYYMGGMGWKIVDGKPEPTYILKYATSTDGINWLRENKIAIPFKNENEGGLVSASVIKLNSEYLMWFGYRNFYDYRNNLDNTYRIGFALSKNGVDWIRQDEHCGISVSKEGWDSEMISYPYVIRYKNTLYMFYNGNHFGKTGFGYATCNI